jgi:3'-phosphoadenosine 5'-phosphosulfate sulfotransferase (PAPS reductase)/FAD synthetase
MRKFIIFSSYGNDSIALIQWAKNNKCQDVTVLFSNTGWERNDWLDRVNKGEELALSYGFKVARTESVGFRQLVLNTGMFPRQGIQFCTLHLKIKPALEWLDKNDLEKKMICVVGVRREESNNRKNFPKIVRRSPNHGGRICLAPMIEIKERERDSLIQQAGFTPLSHRSMECFPCINSNRQDIRILAEFPDRIDLIEKLEIEMGYTKKKGKLKTFFRPYRHMGATGIKQVIKWGLSNRGKFSLEDGTGEECQTGFCGI